MKKIVSIFMVNILMLLMIIPTAAFADTYKKYTVQSGESLWRIALKFQIGFSEILQANSHLPNPDLIYPNQAINVSNIDSIKAIEREVMKLCNAERAKTD